MRTSADAAMVSTVRAPLVRTAARFLETLGHGLCRTVGFPTPVLLQTLAPPLRTTPPIPRTNSSVVITCPVLSLAGKPGYSVLIGPSLHHSVVSRNFGSDSKPGVAQNELMIPFNPEETALTLSGKAALDKLANHIESNVALDKPRDIRPN